MGWQHKCGKLVEFAGLDGSGKTTQLSLAKQALVSAGYKVGVMKFPTYKGPVGGLILRILNSQESVDSPKGRCALFGLDRLAHKDELMDLLVRNDIVLVDRYCLSQITNAAGLEDTGEQNEVMRFAEYVDYELVKLPRADMTIYIDAPVELCQSRIADRAVKDDNDVNVALQHRARQMYWTAASARASVHTVASMAGDSAFTPESINKQVLQLIKDQLSITV